MVDPGRNGFGRGSAVAPTLPSGLRLSRMYNWSLQDAIVAFVQSQKPNFQAQHDIYLSVLYAFVDMQSHLLTLLGFPPVP